LLRNLKEKATEQSLARRSATSTDTLELGVQQFVAVVGRGLDVGIVAMAATSHEMANAIRPSDHAAAIAVSAASRIGGSCQGHQQYVFA
jgi:hypothetical protein